MLHKERLAALWQPQVARPAGQSLAEIVAVIGDAVPNGRLERIIYYSDPSLPLAARVFLPGEAIFHVALVDPRGPEVLSTGPFWQYPLQLAERLHVSLVSGETGHRVLFVEALALVFLGLSGLYIWWPGGRLFRALRIGWHSPPMRRHRDLHVVPGALMSVLLVLTGLTGAAIVADPLTRAAVSLFAPVTPEAIPKFPTVERPARPLSWDAAFDKLQQRFPDGKLRQLRFVAGSNRVLGSVMTAASAANPRAHHIALVDRFTGELTVLSDGNRLPAGDAFLAWILPLHTGEIYGPIRPLIMSLVAIALGGMVVTGFLMWSGKRQVKKQRREGGKPAADKA